MHVVITLENSCGGTVQELEATVRDGDPDAEGVIWPHIAEISLLGALGCGRALVQLALNDIQTPEGQYDYVVLQVHIQ